jgi:6-pyruvoyltetrahydropterin/6-carboxytetrahydropterin synthase
MYEVMVEAHFSASHQIKGYNGNCAKLHGHNWKVRVYVRSHELDTLGLVIDFRLLKKMLQEILSHFDHSLINEHPDFIQQNPTSENLARWIYGKMKEKLAEQTCHLYAVEIFESESAGLFYTEDE